LLDFEASLLRLPPDLKAALRGLRTIADQAGPLLERFVEAERASEGEIEHAKNYLHAARSLTEYTHLLTDGTDDPDLPADLQALMRRDLADEPRRGTRAARSYPIVLRSVSAPNYRTKMHERALNEFRGKLDTRLAVNWEPTLLSFVEIPRSFCHATLFHLIVLGHEQNHIEQTQLKLEGVNTVRELRAHLVRLPSDAVPIADAWISELLADAVCVRRYGPAALLVFADYIDVVSIATQFSPTHPPGDFRLQLMYRSLVGAGFLRAPRTERSGPVLRALHRHRNAGLRLRGLGGPQYAVIAPLLWDALPAIIAAAKRFAPSAYGPTRLQAVEALARDFTEGIARSDAFLTPGATLTQQVADLFNGAAVVRYGRGLRDLVLLAKGRDARRRGFRPTVSDLAAAAATLDALLARAIEGVRFAAEWQEVASTAAPASS
jgi:hypothetical protein